MTIPTQDLFKDASLIAEKRIRHARAEQAAVTRDIARAVLHALFGKDRMNANPAPLRAPRKA